ncbi:MAG: hypothetical protein JWQ76_5283 [Ramlibacter sp.]|nr:hypothetical protein [Ramlibacter sp.]
MSALMREWWEAGERGVLLYRACPACGSRTFVARTACPACSTAMEWRESRRNGTVHAVTTVHRSTVTAAGRPAPYTTGYVELEEGVRMLVTFAAGATAARIGDSVVIAFERVGDRALPVATLPGGTRVP